MLSSPGTIKPIRLWQSLVLFMGPGLYGLLAHSYIFPWMVRRGVSAENAYNTTHLSVFLLLLGLTVIGLRSEDRSLTLTTIRDRLRFRRMDARAWKWTVPFLLIFLGLGLVLNLLGQFVFGKLDFVPPGGDIPLTNIPFMVFVLLANVICEELWWRGYILPRQELEHGKLAWLVNGVLWALFHMFKWYAVPFMLLNTWILPYLSQRTGNNTPAFLIHLVSNSLGILLSILPLMSGS